MKQVFAFKERTYWFYLLDVKSLDFISNNQSLFFLQELLKLKRYSSKTDLIFISKPGRFIFQVIYYILSFWKRKTDMFLPKLSDLL